MIRVSKWDDVGGYLSCTCLFIIIHGPSSGDKSYEIGVATHDCLCAMFRLRSQHASG